VKKFGLIGAAGYVAPRHMRAIKDNNCDLVAAIDPFDSVGIIDSYFPGADFFTEIERFDRHVDKLRRTSGKIDYISICSPNYLHDSHIRLALRSDCDVICEKPLVVEAGNLQYLKDIEKETGRAVNCILQLRHHPVITDIREKYRGSKKVVDVDLEYTTSRGRWYHQSWKGQESKSGGLAANIGIHFFDMLIWIFGPPVENIVESKCSSSVSGTLILERASVKWRLSTDKNDLPVGHIAAGKPAFRRITIDNQSDEFSGGFTDLHTISYKEVLSGNGFGIDDAMESLMVVNKIAKSVM
jgi:UDP-N-acetyl-2-amino-2-deoxyglucuronate dehydrogenase